MEMKMMSTKRSVMISALAICAIYLAGCAPDESGAPVSSAPAPEPGSEVVESEPVASEPEEYVSELAGTAWRLVRIMEKKVHETAPGARLVRLSEPPVIGAVLIALMDAGYSPTKAVRETMSASLERLRGKLSAE